MSNITSIAGPGTTRIDTTYSRPAAKPAAQPQVINHGEDAVELSAEALSAGGVGRETPVRADLVSRIRAQIADGTYETPDKLDIAIDRLAKDLFA